MKDSHNRTKAEVLEFVGARLTVAKILPQFRASVADWTGNRDDVLERFRSCPWCGQTLIVRSSSRSEDQAQGSQAGRYLSVLNVGGEDEIARAIDAVVDSFGADAGADQFFVQPMLANVAMSGVVFSRDPSSGAPYVIVNYDAKSARTDSVTGGRTNELVTFYFYRHIAADLPAPMDRIRALVEELETILELDSIDVEFAIDTSGDLYLFQVRPLAVKRLTCIPSDAHRRAVESIVQKVRDGNAPHPYLFGTKTIYGVMPDWNPAEIIGLRPRPLALSLYQELVTNNIWAYQRHNYGYKNLRSFPLLLSFSGLPYIDVRVSFNSFVPQDVPPELADRLVNYYIERLHASPSHHDKVEFEIVYSCYTLDLPDRLQSLLLHGFTGEDVQSLTDSLRLLTNRIIHNERGLWCEDIERIKTLEHRFDTIRTSKLDLISKIHWIVEDCKRYGTLPFAGLARAGFIAVQMLRSLVTAQVISKTEYNSFLSSLHTISSQIGSDFDSMTRGEFLKKYGHLRPGTYDILSPRYDEAPDLYFDWSRHRRTEPKSTPPFAISLAQLNRLQGLLREHQLDHDAVSLLNFIKSAIEGREYSKFVFTRSVSEVLSLINQLAAEHGLTNEDSGYLSISSILELYSSSTDIDSHLRHSVEQGLRRFDLARQLILPPLITAPEDILAFEYPPLEPNFVTLGRVCSHVAFVDDPRERLPSAILFIPTADPGYDWIFSHGIAGLVTQFGGANSHMAIRAAELNIPAIIGAGEALYREWSAASTLEIDCENRRVRIVRAEGRSLVGQTLA